MMGRKVQSREEWNRVGRWEMIMPRTGAHWEREYEGINTVRSIIDRGELDIDEGKRSLVHEGWKLERGE